MEVSGVDDKGSKYKRNHEYSQLFCLYLSIPPLSFRLSLYFTSSFIFLCFSVYLFPNSSNPYSPLSSRLYALSRHALSFFILSIFPFVFPSYSFICPSFFHDAVHNSQCVIAIFPSNYACSIVIIARGDLQKTFTNNLFNVE